MMKRMISLPPGMVAEFALHEKRDADSWFVDADPEGLRVGSGGGTAHILANAWKASGDSDFGTWLNKEKRLIVHSGGESRRLPAYASFGKSLIPMPVFRWSKGQSLDQKLLDLQLGFYEDILSHAPPNYRTLVGSGDVMFLYGDRFNALPEADVLVFGLWVPDEVASRHGVFFSRRTSPEELAFVKQKPGLNELQSSAEDYLYLMDSGIVLMNEKATRLLMERCGWNADRGRFKNGSPAYYDLYSDMLTAFGEEASGRDEELSSLKVRMHPMSDGSFYHFGSNRDLIDACLRLQNRVRDQRLTLSREDA
ncbi:MAG: bifunctional fucokinase/L-fucose-1-P-guanylyltransferase, partial [Bacteroidetes bacterium]